MGMRRQTSLGRLVRLAAAIAGFVALVALAWGHIVPQPAQADESGPRMSIRLEGAGVNCDDASNPTECNMDPGTSFTLFIDIVEFPAPSYISAGSFIDYGQLVYSPTAQADPEIVAPDMAGFQLRGQTCDTCVNHGGTTAMVPPFPESTYTGTFVQLAMQCSQGFSSNDVKLIPYGEEPARTDGSLFVKPDNAQIPSKADSVTVNCGVAPTVVPSATAEATALPTTGGGTGAISNGGGTNAALWAGIAAAVAAAVAGVGLFAWRRARVH